MPSLDEFFYVSADALCLISKNGEIKEASPSFESLLGYTVKELKGKDWKSFVHPDDRSASSGTSFENRMLARDGSNKWVLWKTTPSEAGDLLLVGRDITNEKAAQNELHVQNRKIAEAKARNDAVLASIGDGVIVVSDKGEVIFANAQALSMLDLALEKILGKHLISAIGVVAVEPMKQALIQGKKITTADLYFSKSDGAKFPVAITASPVFLQDVLIGGVLVFRDITHEKEVDRMKTEFISLASHQLRTPLSTMKWFAEMLLSGDSGELTGEQKKMVNNIYVSNERMIELVNGLLNITRIESGRLMIDPKPTNLKKLIDEVLVDLQPKIAQKKHNIVVSVHSQLPEIKIDPKLIRHVYANLLANAVKYTPEGGEIQVIVSRATDGLVSQVSDNGYGIPEAQHGKVFQKFFRGANVTKIEIDGTGLGLYMVKSIVEASGGRIWFKSKEGAGTTFWFSLPLSGSPAKEGEVSINS